MIGADLAYMGTRFISTQECLSNAYKQMLTTAASGDIVLTDAVTGVNANFINKVWFNRDTILIIWTVMER